MRLFLTIGSLALSCSWLSYGQLKQREPAPYTPAAKNVTDSINQWEQVTKVKVYSDARSQIEEDAAQLKSADVYIPKERFEEALLWTKDIVVKTYLYAVWARNRAQMFITKAQVQAYRLGEYVKEYTPFRDPFGEIEFISRPSGASIKQDNRDLGITRSGFAVSGQAHDYAIVFDQYKLNCRSRIQVTPGTSRKMVCPPTNP